MKFIALKTSDGAIKGNISFYCKILDVTRQGDSISTCQTKVVRGNIRR